MLTKLTIHNIALIKHIELDFCDKLNILSGETGAGKSIIVDGIMLLLGSRYDKSILRYGEERGFVEGVFSASTHERLVLKELGLDEDEIIIINRRFSADGKSDIKINGRTASISMLRELTGHLVDIYGQNEYLSLSRVSEHLKIINYFVRREANEVLLKVQSLHSNYLKLCREIKELGSDSERERNIDMLRFQISEIEKARVLEGEEEELLSKRKIMADADSISKSLAFVKESFLNLDDSSVCGTVDEAGRMLISVSRIDEKYAELQKRIESVSIELNDIAETASEYASELNFDEHDFERVEYRLDIIRSLKRKYGSFYDMEGFLESSKILLNKLENSTDLFLLLQKQKKLCIEEYFKAANQLSAIRREGSLQFVKLIEKELIELGMPDASFSVQFNQIPPIEECEAHLGASGFDKPEFYFSANAGQPQKPLIKIISGGELSRFMLALKVVISQTDDIPTLIFDEVDTGISGKIGQVVAKKLAIISRSHQVLCVSHLPQIASMADNHYFIQKNTACGETVTEIGLLDENGIIDEISRLSGAKDISTQSAQNAKEMKLWSNDFKSSIES